MKPPFTCMLCRNSGRPTLAPRAKRGWAICEDCDEAIRASGRAWCNQCAHVVPKVARNGCSACHAAYRRRRWATDPAFRAKAAERTKRWKEANRDRLRAYDRRYHQLHQRNPSARRSWWRKKYTGAFKIEERARHRAYGAWCRARKRRAA